MIKVSDFIANFLVSKGIRFVHLVAGGGSATLTDSFCKHPKLKYIAYNSEAGASYSAFGESKYTGKLSVVNVSSGICGITVLPGILSAWHDSIPILIISGSVNLQHTSRYYKLHKNLNLRQVGVQDNNSVEIAKNLTKYSVMIEKAEDVLYELEKCCYLAMEGRPSPVWLDIPSSIANSYINPSELRHYDYCDIGIGQRNNIPEFISLKEEISKSTKPLIIAGGGIGQSQTINQFNQFIEKYQIPFVNSFLGVDYTNYNNQLRLGTLGIKANRNANWAVNSCDLLLVLGCTLNVCHIGYLTDRFAPKAKKIAIDIDWQIHSKDLIKMDKVIICNLREFFAQML